MMPGRISFRARAAWWLGRLGWPALVGAGLLLFVLMFHFSGIAPNEQKLAQINGDITRLQARLKQPEKEDAEAHARQAALEALFPPLAEREDLIQQIHDVADLHGIELNNIEYKLFLDPSTPLARVQMLMPVKGSYIALRAWLADVMNGIPSTALEEFNLHRDNGQMATVEGQVRLTLYLDARPSRKAQDETTVSPTPAPAGGKH